MTEDGRETVRAWLADPANEAELLRVLWGMLWKMRDQMPPLATEEHARALLVEVVATALESKTGFDPARGASVKGWLLGVANNVLRRWRERHIGEVTRRAPGDAREGPPGELHERLIDSLRSGESVEGSVVGSLWLEQILAQCPPADRDLLVCLYVERRTPESAARHLGITAGNLRIRHMRALNRLRDRLGEDDLTPAAAASARRGYAGQHYRGEEGGAR